MYSIRRVITYNCHLAWWSGAIQRMLFGNIHWKVLYPAEQEEAWDFKTSFKRRQWHLLVWINRGMIVKQDMTSKQTSDDQTNQYTIEAEAYTRRAWRHTFTKSDRRLQLIYTRIFRHDSTVMIRLACSRLSDSGEDAKGKGTRKVGGAGKRKKEGRESL